MTMKRWKTDTNVNERLKNRTRLFKRARGTSKMNTFLIQQPAQQQGDEQLNSTHLYAADRPTARLIDTAWRGSSHLKFA